MTNFKVKVSAVTVLIHLVIASFVMAQGASTVVATPTPAAPNVQVAVTPTTTIGTHYFLGKWDMTLIGIPGGDKQMPVIFEIKKDSVSGAETWTGKSEKTATSEGIVFSKVEAAADSSITFYFSAQGYDLNITLDKKDMDTAEGRMIDMFDVKAVRTKK